MRAWIVLLAVMACHVQPPVAPTIYLVMPDRFADGDPGNDRAVAGCFDPADPRKLHGGDFAGLRAHIAYLRELGVSMLWLTPAYRQSADRCGYHGYWADFTDPDDGAIAPNLGNADELAGLVVALHGAAIRVVLDMVVNHAGIAARVVAQHPAWFHDAATCHALGDPKVFCPIGGEALPDFAQEVPAVAAYLTATSVRWMTRFGFDGVRMDSVKHVDPAFWARSWFPAMRAAVPGLFVVGEVLDGSPAALAPALAAGFDSLFDYPRYGAIVSVFADGGSLDALADAVATAIATYGAARAARMTTFVDNHDQPRLVSRMPAGTPPDVALARFRLALGALFTLPGVPQLMWGDELALLGGVDPDNRHDMPAWAWTSASRAGPHAGALGDGQAQFAYVQRLIAVRAAHPALRDGSYAELWRPRGGADNVLVFVRRADSERLVVAIGAGDAVTISVPVADATVARDLLGAGAPATATIRGGQLTLALPARTIAIYDLR